MGLNLESPKENANFEKYWNEYLADIEQRENLKQSHLNQLRILCDLSIEYDLLNDIILEKGMTFESVGRNGLQIHMRPEIMQRNRVVVEIRNYSKMLGLVLYKDKSTNDKDKKNEFDEN